MFIPPKFEIIPEAAVFGIINPQPSFTTKKPLYYKKGFSPNIIPTIYYLIQNDNISAEMYVSWQLTISLSTSGEVEGLVLINDETKCRPHAHQV